MTTTEQHGTTGSPRGLVISGTYSSGKTTTSTALAIATGLPRADGQSAREILTELYPGRQFAHMDLTELIALGLRRFEERVTNEQALSGVDFISDGSVLHEWVYGTTRLRTGINPGAPLWQRLTKAVIGLPALPFLRRYLAAYGTVATLHARAAYRAFVHLPVEFPMNPDGHRPVSERYRHIADEKLRRVVHQLDLPLVTVRGTAVERVQEIIDIFHLPQRMSSEEAVDRAHRQIARSRETVAQRILSQHRELGVTEKLKIATRF
ncbi:AAA family ATPase [Galbitalea soli]|uniref:AAA family ATPase n=1 Tax=Galbitalea soli TaxID=1268042 RepID=A0A7C9TRK8_9MICO|nr:AAA family ATPase [Galbitalea soli]NEM92118.1 AAA family ATPase [Galbitalea soli]NYJ31930.1 hypothetical protein [Galbitalea soli]